MFVFTTDTRNSLPREQIVHSSATYNFKFSSLGAFDIRLLSNAHVKYLALFG